MLKAQLRGNSGRKTKKVHQTRMCQGTGSVEGERKGGMQQHSGISNLMHSVISSGGGDCEETDLGERFQNVIFNVLIWSCLRISEEMMSVQWVIQVVRVNDIP